MKKLLRVLIALVALAGVSVAQELSADKVPANVRKSLQSKFRGVSMAQWKLKSDKNYEAEFMLNGVEVAAKFDTRGRWLETESAIEQTALSKDVLAAISKNMKGYQIIETQKVERADHKPILFEVHLENSEEILKVQFEGSGKVSSKSTSRKKKP